MKTYEVKVNDCGNRSWRRRGQLHREDGPAIEYASGTRVWYLNDKRHREDGPAVEYADGGKEWWLNGQELTEEDFNARRQSCAGKIVEIEGKRYRLVKEN